jgi:hypothetical protein
LGKARSMLYMINYNIREGKMKEFQAFIKKNEKAYREHAPKGWKLVGEYCYVLGFGPYCAAELWEISDYADFDTFRNHKDPTWLQLLEKSMEFQTTEPTPAWLLREARDTKITEPKKKP